VGYQIRKDLNMRNPTLIEWLVIAAVGVLCYAAVRGVYETHPALAGAFVVLYLATAAYMFMPVEEE
jgi:hypothetical protein